MRFMATVALVLTLAGCGTAAPSAAPGPGFNPTDVMFAQMLLSHQTNADKMLALVAKRKASAEVQTLASAIKVTQADESKVVEGWLTQWNQPTTVDVKAEGHGAHGGLSSNGEAELAALTKASDADFEKTFLNIFIGYQHQAVEYAKMELTSGVNRDAVALAKRVDQSRRGQIEMMLKMVN